MPQRTMSSEERAQERLVKKFMPPRSHITCPQCGESMSWECKPEVVKRGGFPVSTGTIWGKIWCRCGLLWEAVPWPQAGIPLPQPDEPVETGKKYLRKYKTATRPGAR